MADRTILWNTLKSLPDLATCNLYSLAEILQLWYTDHLNNIKKATSQIAFSQIAVSQTAISQIAVSSLLCPILL